MAYRRLAPLDRNPTILYTESDVDDRHELAANDFVLLEDAKTKNWEVASRNFASDEIGLERGQNKAKRPLMGDDDDLFSSDEEIVEVKPAAKKVKGQGPQVMRWCVTYNNPTITAEAMNNHLIACDGVKGFVFQEETGANGTKHFQMYLEFKLQVRYTGVKSVIGNDTVHCEPAKAQKMLNIAYCSKEDTRTGECFKWGTCTTGVGQGKRSDVDRIGQAVLETGAVTEELVNSNPGVFIKYGRHINSLLTIRNKLQAEAEQKAHWTEQVRRRRAGEVVVGQQQRDCILFFGPTGCRKTSEAKLNLWEEFEEAPYEKAGNGKWWCGYDQQKGVIVDEWQKGLGSMEDFNMMTNVGGPAIEVKGGSTSLVAKKMYFTTNRHPLDIWDVKYADGRFRAVARRFAEVHWWNDAYVLTKLVNPDRIENELEKAEALVNWVHFWKGRQRPIIEGDEVVAGDDNYFTW